MERDVEMEREETDQQIGFLENEIPSIDSL